MCGGVFRRISPRKPERKISVMFDIYSLKGRFLNVHGERVNRLSQINQLANEIGLLAHVISKMKMAETLLSEMQEKSCLCPILVMKGATMARTVLNDSLSNRWNCLNASSSSAFN